MNKKYSLLILLALLLPLGLQAQKPPQDMDRFLDNLLNVFYDVVVGFHSFYSSDLLIFTMFVSWISPNTSACPSI